MRLSVVAVYVSIVVTPNQIGLTKGPLSSRRPSLQSEESDKRFQKLYSLLSISFLPPKKFAKYQKQQHAKLFDKTSYIEVNIFMRFLIEAIVL